MSAARAYALPAPHAARPGADVPQPERPSVPHLVVVPSMATGRTRPTRAPFVVLISALLVAGLMALLLLNTLLAQDSFALHALQKQTASLSDTEQALAQEVARAQTPQSLAQRATGLGMVPAPNPVFRAGPDGQILGVATPASPPVAGAGGTSKATP